MFSSSMFLRTVRAVALPKVAGLPVCTMACRQVNLCFYGAGPKPSRGKTPQAHKREKVSSGLSGALATFWKFSLEQKLSVLVGVVAFVAFLPKLMLLGFVGIERALVGGIIAVESAIVAAAQYLLTSAAGLGVVAFVLLTTMAFLFPRSKDS